MQRNIEIFGTCETSMKCEGTNEQTNEYET